MTSRSVSPAEQAKIALDAGIRKAIKAPRPFVVGHINQSRRKRPDAAPAEIAKVLERRFLAAVTSTGAGTGAVAAVPAVGVAPALALAGGDFVAFTSAAGLLALSLAELHDVPVTDLERRRTLVMGVLLGDSGSSLITKAAGRTGGHWGKQAVNSIPMSTIKQVNKMLGHNFVTKYGTKQGIVVLGKAVPFGIGAAIGAGGNFAFGRMTVQASRRAFGPAPETWPSGLA